MNRLRPSVLEGWVTLAALVFAGCTGVISNPGQAPPPEPEVVHWAFVAPAEADPPGFDEPGGLVANGIDAFVLARLQSLGLEPAPLATPEKLIRRVTLTLTGLPPSLEEVDAFVADPSDRAYSELVDRLLSSRRYAEHMTSSWLDLARYSDTDGYQYDRARDAWAWRDWVLAAFDGNMPFDEFTVQQLAGDLLPDATEQTILATAFNRNHAIQGENGLLLNEFRDRYVSDRLDVLGKTWLGLTVGCAKCHDHRYDPTTADDFYRLYDCFNQIDEKDNGPTSEFSPAQPIASPLLEALQSELAGRIEERTAAGASASELYTLNFDLTALQNVPIARIMRDEPALRETRRLAQGRYDLPTGDPLNCAAPHFLPAFPEGEPANRLGLARWLLMPEHPLTARVVVNRFWQQHFGYGLVPALDNFGKQTPAPAQLELLDWLAREFISSGWDVKALHRLIVTSNTYRQASETSEAALAADPRNDLLARGPRFRLSAEVVRDLPLAVSGLLVERFGGPPAWPYQPEGLWEELSWESNMLVYPRIVGDGLYRRSVYSFWKRTLPPPFMSLFDAPDREQSAAFREPAITPQQALALLNGPQFVEAARQLAARLLEETSGDVDAALSRGFRLVTSRLPNDTELGVLRALYADELAIFAAAPTALTAVQSAGSSPPSALEPTHGALTQVARVLFNLSETITQE